MSWAAIARAVLGAALTTFGALINAEQPAVGALVSAAGGALGARDVVAGVRALVNANRARARAAAPKEPPHED